MYETEIKLKYNNKDEVVEKLKVLGANLSKNEEIVDKYYSNETNSLTNAKKFLRIRQKNGISEITFKGEIQSEGDIWKRVELNVPIGNADDMSTILQNLGFCQVLKNRTLREYWYLDGFEVAIINILDPAVVNYLEIEGNNEEGIRKIVNGLGNSIMPLPKNHFEPLDKARGGRK